ncbi:MAG: PIN domain-containing protein [Proteobacteria bacterium]|nr:PIN domain-containing protein [Pseudomonadota bacterium]
MSGADFFDSNVLLYLFDETAPAKSERAGELVTQALARGTAVISYQVVQETLHVLSRKFRIAAKPEHAIAFLRDTLQPLWQVQPSVQLYEHAVELRERLRFGFYDSLIVAAALQAGCKRLLTEDLQHGQKIDGLRIENPFRA